MSIGDPSSLSSVQPYSAPEFAPPCSRRYFCHIIGRIYISYRCVAGVTESVQNSSPTPPTFSVQPYSAPEFTPYCSPLGLCRLTGRLYMVYRLYRCLTGIRSPTQFSLRLHLHEINPSPSPALSQYCVKFYTVPIPQYPVTHTRMCEYPSCNLVTFSQGSGVSYEKFWPPRAFAENWTLFILVTSFKRIPL